MKIKEHQFIVPAQIKTLILPIGSDWTSKTFNSYVEEHLEEVREVRLLDVSTKSSREEATFDPRAFPSGRLLFDFRMSILDDDADDSLIFLSDFEPYRKTFIVIGVVDSETDYDDEFLTTLQSKYPNVMCHCIIKISSKSQKVQESVINGEVFCDNGHNLHDVMCSVGDLFLLRMEKHYKSYQHVTLRSPGAIGGDSVLKPAINETALKLKHSDANYLQRSKANYKINIDQKLKSDSRQMKILGNFQLLTGQYSQSLQNFNRAALISHKLGDYLWLASCLDGISVCISLLTYINYSIPMPSAIEQLLTFDKSTICVNSSPTQNLNNTTHSTPRTSASFGSSPRTSESNYRAPFINEGVNTTDVSLMNTANVISPLSVPLLLKLINDKILHYYDYTLFHQTEFTPHVVYLDSLLRFLECLQCMHLKKDITFAMDDVVKGPLKKMGLDQSQTSFYFQYDRMYIYEYSNKILEFELSQNKVFQQLKIYVSLIKVYQNLGFKRKSLLILRNVVNLLLKQERAILFEWENKSIHAYLFEHCYESLKAESKWGLLEKSLLLGSIELAHKCGESEKAFDWSMGLLGNGHKYLSSYEQLKLLNEIVLPSKFKNKKFVDYEAIQLLKSVKLLRMRNSEFQLPVRIAQKDVSADKLDANNNTLYNPFEYLKSEEDEESKIQKNTLAFQSGEVVTMKVTLLNPFKFDIDITCIELLEHASEYFDLGTLNFENLKVLPEGEENFLLDIRVIKSGHEISVDDLKIGVFHFQSVTYQSLKKIENIKSINYVTEYDLIPCQPDLAWSTEPSPLIIQEGGECSTAITVQNTSLSEIAEIYSVTVVLPSFYDSKNKNTPSSETYQQKLLSKNLEKCFKFEKPSDTILCNGSLRIVCTLSTKDVGSIPVEFNRFRVDIEYGRKEKSPEYMKKLQIAIDVTFLKNLELTNLEVLPFQRNQLYSATSLKSHSDVVDLDSNMKEDWFGFLDTHENYNWVLFLDIRNTWIENIHLKLHYSTDFASEEKLLQSKQSKRFAIPLDNRILTENYNKFIPGSKDKSVIFWIRENLINMVKCTWRCEEMNNKLGQLDLRKSISLADCQRFLLMTPHNKIHLELDQKKDYSVGQVVKIKITNSLSLCKMKLMILDSITGSSVLNSHRVLLNGSKTFRMATGTMTLDLIFVEPGAYEINYAIESEDLAGPVKFGSKAIMLNVNPEYV